MYFSTALVVLASAFIPGVLSTCEDFAGGHTYCKWYGTAPACGTSKFEVGEWDGDEQLKATTKRYSPRELLYYNRINEECYEDYGNTCYGGGYKRLWCKSTPYLLTKEETISAGFAAGSKHPHQKPTVNIEIDLN
ncbi:hypothetical protein BKA61DRAFT_681326 [Leptodontidium sp. MPI-SDFR-AT-0119]|nr:hypothetical protein BKA61DRAFT_681326 [Leptodontidium sp. MPI-SDFR-AT-0119]